VTASRRRARHQLTEAGRKRLEELKGEALEYLVQVFTEDERKDRRTRSTFWRRSAAPSTRARSSPGWPTHSSRRRATTAPSSRSAFWSSSIRTTRAIPIARKRIVEALREMDENKEAIKELRRLAESYGPGSDWAKAQQNPAAVEHAHKLAADMLREVAKGAARRRAEKRAATEGHIDTERYARAADAYSII